MYITSSVNKRSVSSHIINKTQQNKKTRTKPKNQQQQQQQQQQKRHMDSIFFLTHLIVVLTSYLILTKIVNIFMIKLMLFLISLNQVHVQMIITD